MLVAVLLVPVLLGMSALAIDGGSLYVGRRQAQNGADAAALALAQACATGQPTCATSTTALDPLVMSNSGIGTGQVLGTPCIQRGDGSCAGADLSSLPQCPYPLPSGANGVQVHTRTTFNRFFATIWGGAAQSQTDACASAAWGSPGPASATIPFTFSACEWSAATGGSPSDPNSGTYPAGPPYPPYPAAAFERTIMLNSSSSTCTTWNGHDVPGGFGWLDDGGSGTCEAPTSAGAWKHIKTGVALPTGCAAVLAAMLTNPSNRKLYLPVYDCMADHDPGVPPVAGQECDPSTATGNNVWYHLAGYAQFYVTGYLIGGAQSKSIITMAYPCSSSEKCISGFFLKGLIPEADLSTDPNSPDFGVSAVNIVG